MARTSLKLNRRQLGAFLSDFDSIRQFEQLFSEVDAAASSPSGSNGPELEAGVALATANDAMDAINNLYNELYPGAIAPVQLIPSMESISDVSAPTPVANYAILQRNAGTGRWEATSIAKGLKYGGTSTDYTEFEADGTLKMNGSATVWNDWNLSRDFTATAGAGVPTRNTLVGNIVKDQFAVNDALQYMSTELLHDWKEGSDMQIHIHWATGGLNDTTVRGVKWEVEYTVCNPLESGVSPTVFTAAATQSLEVSIPAAQPDRTHRVSTIYTIPGSTLKIGAQLLMRLKRIASVTNPAPAADPFVISFGVHFEADTLGSRSVSTK